MPTAVDQGAAAPVTVRLLEPASGIVPGLTGEKVVPTRLALPRLWVVALIMYDDDIRARLSPSDAVRWMTEAIDAQHHGELVTPPRVHADVGGGRLVFTTGRLRGAWFGYRSYDSLPAEPGSQLVVVHDDASGKVRAVAIGNEIGPRRVGAIGAVAADALAPPSAGVVAVIGTGHPSLVPAVGAVRCPRAARGPRLLPGRGTPGEVR